MNLVQRIKSPTPRFFRQLRNLGLVLAAVSGAIMTAPLMLPSFWQTIAGYLALTGGILSVVSQLTTGPDAGRREVGHGTP